jgi:hypothetical protein
MRDFFFLHCIALAARIKRRSLKRNHKRFVMDAELVSQFQGITGAPPEQARMFLEMSGGNLETAMSLFFDGGADGGQDFAIARTDVEQAFDGPPWYTLVWEKKEAVPISWLGQELKFDGNVGLVQCKNGPCGVLAAINAIVIAQMGITDPQIVLSAKPEALVSALSSIISQCTASAECKLVAWADGSNAGDGGLKVKEAVLPKEQLKEYISDHLSEFTAPGGLVLLVYSCLLTRGEDQIHADIRADGGEPPLIVGPHALCTTELLSLLLRGRASGNVGAFSATGTPNKWATWEGSEGAGAADGELVGRVGLLSFTEVETGIPLCDLLKSPAAADGSPVTRVWVLHGGDHFTMLFAGGDVQDGSLQLWHWNGLPPGGPRMCRVTVSDSSGQLTEAAAAPAKHVETFYKPVVGEIDEVVQVNGPKCSECS